ncbi:MAG: hypothetical protein ACERKR_06660 [Deltaproteobacteria bacterium]
MPDEMEPQLPLSEGELLPCGIVIDREGDWYYQGSRMHRADIVSHLCQHLGRDESSGLYIIQMGKQRCYLEVEDTPLVITGVLHTAEREGDKPEQLLLAIKHLETRESLDPESLWIGEQNVLYCRVMEGEIPARFLRPAYYQLAEFIQEDKEQNRFYLSLGGKRFYIGVNPG